MNLNIRFKTVEEYNKAVKFVESESVFYGENNKEWSMITVECLDQQDAWSNEKEINEELIEAGFNEYYFEIED